MIENVSRETIESGLVKIGYYRESPTDAGWLYEIVSTDAVTRRLEMLLNESCVKKISVTKNYGI